MTTEKSEFQTNRRPSKAITFAEKLAILRELEAGSSRREVEVIFKCSQSTISRVLLSRDSILQMTNEGDEAVNGKRDPLFLNKEIDEPLTLWAHEMKRCGEAITASMVMQKARDLSKEIGHEFICSAQWLYIWKTRENVKFIKSCNEGEEDTEILKGLLDRGKTKEDCHHEQVKRLKQDDSLPNNMNSPEDKNLETENCKSVNLNESSETANKPRTKREYIRRLPAFMKVEGGSEYPGTIYRSRKEKTFLTLLQKLEILQRLKNGERRPDLIIEYKLSQSAMSQIVADEMKIVKLAEGGQNLQMKRVRGGIFKDGEAELNSWVQHKMKIGESLTRTQIKNKAKEIADRLHIDFKASTGWLEKWKARMNLDFNEYQILKRKIPSYINNEDDAITETNRSRQHEVISEQEDNVVIKQEISNMNTDENDDYSYDDSADDIKPEFLTPQQFYMQTLQGNRPASAHEEDDESEDVKPFVGTPPPVNAVADQLEVTLHEQVLNWLNQYHISPRAATDLLNILHPHLNTVVQSSKTSQPIPKTQQYT